MPFYQPLLTIMVYLALSCSTLAATPTKQVVNQVINAYGGDALTMASTLTINETYKSTMTGQSETPETLNLREVTHSLVIDFSHNAAQLTRKVSQREITFYQRRIYKNDLFYNINLVDNSYAAPSKAGRQQVSGNAMQLNDIGLARLLFENQSSAQLKPEHLIETIPYHHLTMTLASGENISLYIDQQSHYIIRAEKQHPRLGLIRTDFSKVVQHQGIRFAQNSDVFYGKNLALVVLERNVELNRKLPKDFLVTDEYHQHSPDLYPTEMTVRSLSDNIFLVGKGAVHSLFVVDGDNVVGAESYAGVMARFNALKKHLRRQLTLTDLVVTHHHSDHLSGVNELATASANLVTVAAHSATIKQKMAANFDDSRFVLVNNMQNLANGKVQVFDIATAHSSHNLVMYIPAQQLLFVADHFRSSYHGEALNNFTDLINFKKAIDSLPVKIQTFASVHGIKQLSYQQLTEATATGTSFDCSRYPSICQ